MSKKVAIIASNGGLFDAYKVFNIATTAAASNAEVGIFFTFEGLNLIHKQAHKDLAVPEGKEHIQAGFDKADIPDISEMLEMAKDLGVTFIGCQMTMDVMGLNKESFVDGVDVGGAATFLSYAEDADMTLTF